MVGFTKVKCTDCSQVIHVRDGELPDDLQPGEHFERKCSGCDDGHYMELAEDDGQTESK